MKILRFSMSATLMLASLQAGTFSLDVTFEFTPAAGSLPLPASMSERAVMVATPRSEWLYCAPDYKPHPYENCDDGTLPGHSPVVIPTSLYRFQSGTGAPPAEENISLTNSINTAQSTWASSGYGLFTTGSFSDLTSAAPGFGPLSDSNTVFDASGMAGVFSMNFDCQLTTEGASEEANCFANALLLTLDEDGGNHLLVAPSAVILALRGTGQARWRNGEIMASGTDYVLEIGFNSIDRSMEIGIPPHSETWITSTVVVIGGVVTAVNKTTVGDENGPAMDPFVLPEVGSSGDITIAADVPAITYDFSADVVNDPTQLLIFSTRCSTSRL